MDGDWKVFLEEACHPGAEWRGAPFWALNGELEPNEMRRQVRGFHECGLGGFFLHARTGLNTPYLSERWFECLGAAIDEAEKLGMKAWLYDEDRFPSGSGGGFVTCDPRYRAKGIFLHRGSISPEFPPSESTLACFAAVFEDDRIRSLRRLGKDTSLQPDEELLTFYTDTIQCSSWYNGYTYLDTLSEEAVARFIQVTHEAYARHFGDKFGTVIPGIFTDEPRYGFLIHQPSWDTDKRLALPWTPGLLEKFADEYGYDPVEHLPEYFFEVDGVDSTAPRVHYVETLQRMFLNAFARQISEWCHAHGLLFTGHVVGEDSLSYQTQGVGSAMRFYEYLDMPGMDLLTEHHHAYLTARQLASASRQFGKPRRLCECYGCTGWAFPPIGFQAIGDWLAALGITFRCQHLAFYTMAGEAKRDYPCPVALQSNAPDAYRAQEERAARIAKWLSYGREERSILVISPIESTWSRFHFGWRKEEATKAADRRFNHLCNFLLANHLDFDCGDEDILARHATLTGSRMSVGEAEYSAVVIPPMLTIRRSTLELLLRFRRQGGMVISLDEAPAYVDALPARPEWPFEQCTLEELPPRLASVLLTDSLPQVSGVDTRSLLCHWRRGEQASILFVCNTGHPIDDDPEADGAAYREPAVLERTAVVRDASFRIPCSESMQLAEVDLETGRLEAVPAEIRSGVASFHASFGRLQSRLFVICRADESLPMKTVAPQAHTASSGIPVQFHKACLSEENVLLLDHFTTDFRPENTYVLELDDICRERFGLPTRGLLMKQPWCRSYDDEKGGNVLLRTGFECDAVSQGELFIVMEHPELYSLDINGRSVVMEDAGFWHQPAWRKCRLPQDCICLGRNTLAFTTRLNSRHPGLEAIFLLGRFSANENLEGILSISSPVERLSIGDWCAQGLPFYAGDVTYEAQVELPRACRARICLRDYAGFPAVVEAAGQQCVLQYSPESTPLWNLPERFLLKIRVTGSMRNACGPFWQPDVQPKWCGPDQFKSRKCDARKLLPSGLLGPVEILEEL